MYLRDTSHKQLFQDFFYLKMSLIDQVFQNLIISMKVTSQRFMKLFICVSIISLYFEDGLFMIVF